MLGTLSHVTAGLAQSAEHLSCKEDVVGSIPTPGSANEQNGPWRLRAAVGHGECDGTQPLDGAHLDTRVLIVDDDDRLRDVLAVYIQYEDGLAVAQQLESLRPWMRVAPAFTA